MPVFKKDFKLENSNNTSYLRYIDAHIKQLDDASLVQFASDVVKNLAAADDQDLVSYFEVDMSGELAKFKDNAKARAMVLEAIHNSIKQLISSNGLVFIDAKDEDKFPNMQRPPEGDLSTESESMEGVAYRMATFYQGCLSLTNKYRLIQKTHEQRFNDNDKLKQDFDALMDAYRLSLKEIEELDKKFAGEHPLKKYYGMFKSYVAMLRTLKNIDRFLDKNGMTNADYTLAFMDVMYSLLILAYSWRSAVGKMAYYGLRNFRKACKALAYKCLKYAINAGNRLVAGAVYMAKAVGAAAAAMDPRKKLERLMNQEGLNRAFWEEVGRFGRSKDYILSKKRGKAKTLMELSVYGGPFMDRVGLIFGGIAMVAYIPTKIVVGTMNERYSLINQVKLGVTGSLTPYDKHKNEEFKLVPTDLTKGSNNKAVIVATENYDPKSPDPTKGAIAIVEKQDKGHTVFLVANSAEDCEKMLRLLCKAIKDSDGKELIIQTRVPEQQEEIEHISKAMEKIKVEYKDSGLELKLTLNGVTSEIASRPKRGNKA